MNDPAEKGIGDKHKASGRSFGWDGTARIENFPIVRSVFNVHLLIRLYD